MDRVRQILNPLRHQPPRRAVLSDCNLVIDKTADPSKPEIEALSEICSIAFDTEPRHPADLLRRALVNNVSAAWNALRDDLVCGYSVPLPHEYARDIHRHLSDCPTECMTFVCLTLVCQSPHEWFSSLDIGVLARNVASYSILSPLFCQTIEHLRVPDSVIAETLESAPTTVAFFLGACNPSALCALRPTLPTTLIGHAYALHAAERYAPIGFLALLVRLNDRHVDVSQAATLGIKTLTCIPKKRFDARVAAAASVLAQKSPDPDIAAIASIVETLATALQRQV